MINNIRIIPIEDGGNPRTQFDIRKEEGEFLIHPFSEDDDGNYRFRLEVKIINDSGNKALVPIHIEWGDTEHQEHRNYVLLSKREDQWEKFDATINGKKAFSVVEVPPGESILSLHPCYSYGRLQKFVNSLPETCFHVDVIGKSRHKRDIYAIESGNKDLNPLAIMARVHPYETVGSYFVNGMIKWLMSKQLNIRDFLSKNRVIFIPMPNPDGVAEGNCKLTLGGFNFEEGYGDTSEPEGVAVQDYFYRIKPKAIFELHGWMYDFDYFSTSDIERGKQLYQSLTENSILFGKGIEIKYRTGLGRRKNLNKIIADNLGIVYFNTSWSCNGRSAQDLYDMGAFMLKAYANLY